MVGQKKEKRINQLKEPQKAESGWLAVGYIAMIFGGFVGIFMGYYLSQFKKMIPDGEKVYVYDEMARKNGKIMFYLSIISVIVWFVIYLFVIPK